LEQRRSAPINSAKDAHRERMMNAIQAWIKALEVYPGWREWNRKKIGYTLFHGEDRYSKPEFHGDFIFPAEMEKKHAVVTRYLRLLETVESLKECEFYFRRYPFRGLPVSRHRHITNICEMYFARFYEFKERLKNQVDAIMEAVPDHQLNLGVIIKLYSKEFDAEIRERNAVNHQTRFEDLKIDEVFLTETLSSSDNASMWKQKHHSAYRRLANEWATRARNRGMKLDPFMEIVAAVTLAACKFLEPDAVSEQ
jgi:hypothetical protein